MTECTRELILIHGLLQKRSLGTGACARKAHHSVPSYIHIHVVAVLTILYIETTGYGVETASMKTAS